MQTPPGSFFRFLGSVRVFQPQGPTLWTLSMLNLPASGRVDLSGFRDGDTQRPLYPMVTSDLTYHWNHWQTCATTTYQWFESLWIYQRLGFALLVPGYLSVSRPLVLLALANLVNLYWGLQESLSFQGTTRVGLTTKKWGDVNRGGRSEISKWGCCFEGLKTWQVWRNGTAKGNKTIGRFLFLGGAIILKHRIHFSFKKSTGFDFQECCFQKQTPGFFSWSKSYLWQEWWVVSDGNLRIPKGLKKMSFLGGWSWHCYFFPFREKCQP